MPKMAIPLAQVSGSTPQKMYDAQKKQPIAVMARTWRSDGCAPRPVLGRAAGRAGFRTVLQVMGLSLRARSASGSGGSRGTDKESGFLSRKRHFRVALSCDTLALDLDPARTGHASRSAVLTPARLDRHFSSRQGSAGMSGVGMGSAGAKKFF